MAKLSDIKQIDLRTKKGKALINKIGRLMLKYPAMTPNQILKNIIIQ